MYSRVAFIHDEVLSVDDLKVAFENLVENNIIDRKSHITYFGTDTESAAKYGRYHELELARFFALLGSSNLNFFSEDRQFKPISTRYDSMINYCIRFGFVIVIICKFDNEDYLNLASRIEHTDSVPVILYKVGEALKEG